MKKHIRWLAAVGMTLALLGCGCAMAAGEDSIHVQLDGEELTFTDAVPQVRDQRTFLPFRAVFEAMGAEVSNEGSVITATRDGRTLTMTLNETTATVTQGDRTTAITMDVAPYVDNTTWRTYVPVRFAAQAFDCAVGWDQANATAIIVDTGKVVDKALEGKSFTYLEKLMEYSKKYNEGIWDMEAAFDATVAVMGVNMTMEGSVDGTVADSERLSMDMNMKMDLTELIGMVSMLSLEEAALSAEDQAMLEALKNEGIDLSVRGDMGKGTLYMNMKGDLLAAAGMNGDDWYRMDMAALMAQSGMDWTELMRTSRTLDYTALAKTALSTLSLSDSTAAYDTVKAIVEQVVGSLCDDGFVKEELDAGDEYTAVVAFEEDGSSILLGLVFGMKDGEVLGYSIGMEMAAEGNGTTTSESMTISMDDQDRMSAEMYMEAADMVYVWMSMEGAYAPGQTAPATEPPTGAKVVDLMEEMTAAENAALGVIGGADGPTAVIVGQ